MYSVSTALYEEAKVRLEEAIGRRDYFSGSICFPFDDRTCRLVVSVIVYRSRTSQPEGDGMAISDLVPVWWEFHTEGTDGVEINDFSFACLRHLL